jgi:RHH-type proline utilization regulon transcriptional repressor/proline dehydrogenase/delta 1-pyrroline-5-carboxylate dehydrogenase
MNDMFIKAIQDAYHIDESQCLEILLKNAELPAASSLMIESQARSLVEHVRKSRLNTGGLDAFLSTYDLSSEEGIALMCLAEALLRIPDNDTVDRLIKDKIGAQNWEQHLGRSQSWFVNAATWGLILTGKLLTDEQASSHTLKNALKRLIVRTGEPVIRMAVKQAMKILGRQFVMAETIRDALERAHLQEIEGYRFSYDMLGEAAKTMEDADHYLKAYQTAIEEIRQNHQGLGPILGPGISVKLSALHPRYEWVNRERVMLELLPLLKELVLQAKEANIGFTFDAEEADRLELSLLLLKALVQDLDLGEWSGLGLAVQSYQKRAFWVIDWLIDLAKTHQRSLMVRLVKGAYWDSEIKWAQERGLKNYPVFTRKSSTDVSYLACATKLLKAGDYLFPQFATHNAYTVAAIIERVRLENREGKFEFQCLHGMGNTLYDHIVGEKNLNIPCRVYAPVGGHEHLLGYLVRRLLENGANTSFVNRIIDEQIPIAQLIEDPIVKTRHLAEMPHPNIPLPAHLFGTLRPNSAGINVADTLEINPLLDKIISADEKNRSLENGVFQKPVVQISEHDIEAILNQSSQAFKVWSRTSVETRISCLKRMALLLEQNKPKLMALLIREAGKTVMDSHSELREAIDFCWYYSYRAHKDFQIKQLVGPTGENNYLSLHGRGVMVCISPWNFPLAIFLGQITAALVAGNTVIAKPSSQTPLIALAATELLIEAGIPKEAMQCVIGSGALMGTHLINDIRIAGVLFTGSTSVARGINQILSHRIGPIVPFIAETGGQNVMIVDSSALPEQVVSDVLVSAFNSAGQRCSALRVLCVQKEIAPRIIKMLKGAMAELKIGDPLDLSTDVGPVIDSNARQSLLEHVDKMKRIGKLIYECSLPPQLPSLLKGAFFAPCAYEIESIDILQQEVFGPILHVVRYSSHQLESLLDSINNTGYGLTLGIHSRITENIQFVANQLHVGNMYVNRNMIGAVVGVQPFGGEGLSGTGPKAGGPYILPRLSQERTLSVNIAAAGGNTVLMSLSEGN